MTTTTLTAIPSEIANTCRRFGVQRLQMFGSAARNEMREDSDIDLLISFQPEARPSYFTLSDLSDELEILFGGQHRVDLVTEDELDPLIRKYVTPDLVALYEKR